MSHGAESHSPDDALVPSGFLARHGDRLWQDLRFTTRQLRRSPVFTAVAVLTLALGIGANSALFSIVDAVLLRPLPYPEPDRLLELRSVTLDGEVTSGVSFHDFEDWRRQVRSFSHLAAWNRDEGNLAGTGEAVRVGFARVTPGFFRTLGVEPSLGRSFTAEEQEPGHGRAAILSHAFCQRHFGSESAALGGALHLDGRRLTVVGVAPRGFAFPDDAVDLWQPLALTPEQSGSRGGRWLEALGRLAPGASPTTAREEMTALAARLAKTHPETNEGWSVSLVPLVRATVGNTGRALLLLWGVVALVLVLAGINLAGLLIARAAGRQGEMAVRAALGAQRQRLLRQMLTESLCLAGLGSSMGLALAWTTVRLLPGLAPEVPRLDTVSLDLRALGFAALLTLGCGLLFGLAPAFEAGHRRLTAGLVRTRATGSGRRRGWKTLVAAEVALAVTVLVAAGLLMASFTRLLATDPGFELDRLLTLRVEPPSRVDFSGDDVLTAFEAERHRAANFYDELLRRIEALPGVRSAAAVNRRPLLPGGAWSTGLFLTGDAPETRHPPVRWRAVTPKITAVLGLEILAGRPLTAHDDAGARPVVVVSETLARTYWPGEDPLGRRVTHDEPGSEHALWYTVVGVVTDAHHDGLADPAPPTAFVPMRQARFGFFTDWGMDLLVRTDGEPMALAAAVRRQVTALAPELPAFSVTTLDRVRTDQAAAHRFSALSVSVFALLALALATAGIFGLLSEHVARERHGIGVRMALGADRRRVVTYVVGGGLAMVAAGTAVGLGLAASGARLLASLLHNTTPGDPLPYLAAIILLASAAVVACALPAHRAARTDPARVLRDG